MKKNEIEAVVRATVTETLKQLKNDGRLRPSESYSDVGKRLRRWYADAEPDEAITAALEAVCDDKYADIIPLYYSYNYTLEKLAEAFGVEPSTIARNKKRLCAIIAEKITEK